MELPSSESIFEIDLRGDITQTEYKGQFTCRCVLTMGQKHALELEKSRLLGSYTNPTDELIGIAVIFSNLRQKLIDGPEWWKQSNGGTMIKDENVLVEVYGKIQKAEDEWRQKVKELAAPPKTQQNSL
jgi:hypothetical protein